MVMANESLRNLYKEMYKTAKGNWDLFIIFIEKAMYITKDKGILSLIIPNKLISQDYASDIRKMISNGLLEIRDFSRLNVFENAAVYPITILIKKDHQKQPVNIVSMTSTSEINETKTIDRKKITDLPWDIFFQGSSVISILGKINKSKKPLKEIIQFESPCTVSEAYKIKSVLADKNKTTAVKKFINSGTIDPYTSFWGIRNTSYIKEKYKYPVVSDRELKELSARRFTQSKSKKIIIANMTQNIEAFLDTKTEYLAGKSTVIALGDDNALLIGAALLNSKLVSFWYKCMYHSTKMSGDALSVTSERLGALPVPEISIDNKNALISLVEKILAAKAANPQADTAALEREIDALVYKLYNLSREEISIIES
jgi:hypothetical protein